MSDDGLEDGIRKPPRTETAPPPSSSSGKKKENKNKKPLPKGQIALLCYARMVEPIAFFSVFPFIAQMVQRNGNLADSDVGFYSGLIESLFSAAQAVVFIFWGRLADRLGRKPVLICSLCGMAVGPALFGVATSIGQMVVFRCLAGAFSGCGLIIRTMIGDLCTEDSQALAFTWFAFAGNVGIFLGPLIGGALANPVEQYPGLFAGNRFFQTYPYALPGLVVGFVCATAASTSMLFLEETLDRAGAAHPPGTDNGASPERGPLEAPPSNSMTLWQLVKAPGVAAVLWVYGHVMVLAFAFTAIIPVALFTPADIGGLGCSAAEISVYMATQGASQAMWLLLAFPYLHRRLGTNGVLRLCAIAYPFFFAGYVVMNALLRHGSEAATAWFWVVGCVVVFIGPGVSMVFTGVQLALNSASPTPHLLGTLNAVALTYSSVIRSIVPAVATAVYAVGVRRQILWGHLAWIILIFISMTLPRCLKWLRN